MAICALTDPSLKNASQNKQKKEIRTLTQNISGWRYRFPATGSLKRLLSDLHWNGSALKSNQQLLIE